MRCRSPFLETDCSRRTLQITGESMTNDKEMSNEPRFPSLGVEILDCVLDEIRGGDHDHGRFKEGVKYY